MRIWLCMAALVFAVPSAAIEDSRMMQHAQGTFAVTMTPQPAETASTARFALQKTFTGDLAGTSSGLMLSAGDPAKGEAGYVAIETVTATLAGRRGGFALQHSGTMSGGKQNLQILVVPGSGSGGLIGISGTMQISITGGVHQYTLHYAIPSLS